MQVNSVAAIVIHHEVWGLDVGDMDHSLGWNGSDEKSTALRSIAKTIGGFCFGFCSEGSLTRVSRWMVKRRLSRQSSLSTVL